MQTIIDFLLSANFLISIAIIACAAALWFLLKKAIGVQIAQRIVSSKNHGKKETYLRISANILKYVVVILTVVLVLQINGVNVSSLVTGLGIFSAVVGLSLQDVLKDMIMGLNILEDSFFVVGDVIRYAGHEGEVISFTIKTTKIRDVHTNSIVTISNRNISEIENVSDWLDLVIPAPYEETAERVETVLSEACRRIDALSAVSDCRFLGTDELADSAILYRLRLNCPPANKPMVRRQALRIVQDTFNEFNLTIPYQQLDIHNQS